MIAHWPGKTPVGKVSESLIDSVDFLPTILDVAGASEEIKEPIDGVSFAAELMGTGKSPREWVYVHQDPRPGWDKDRFQLIRLARNQNYKLYEDGRLYHTKTDPYEESPIFIRRDTPGSRIARIELQKVLDAMKPYPLFDPAVMPRPNPTDAIANNEFHDQGGYIVAEAEMLPTPRDESWLTETHLPGYTGTGYLRALRDQASPPSKGITPIHLHPLTAGKWTLAFRCRSDHPVRSEPREFWFKVGDGPWLIGKLNNAHPLGQWLWTRDVIDPQQGEAVTSTFEFKEKRNDVWIAPKSANFKIDRVVAYEADRERKALDTRTPVSPFHQWASP